MKLPEKKVTPQLASQLASDVVSPQGQQQVQGKLASAIMKKKLLDSLMTMIAQKVHGEFTSRIKDPNTIVQKVVQKRGEGRKYNVDDVNDVYGGRIVVKDKSLLPQVKDLLMKVQKAGLFSINKQENVKEQTYNGYHIDIQTPDGMKGEIQVQTPQEELESVANHGIRSEFGEKPPQEVSNLRNTQAKLAKNISDSKAHQKSQQIQQTEQNGTIDPRVIASILQK